MEANFKYEIGQLLTLTANEVLYREGVDPKPRSWDMVGERSRPLVATVISQDSEQCSGGVQLMYNCRLAHLNGGQNSISLQLVRLHEHELMPYPEPAVAPPQEPKAD